MKCACGTGLGSAVAVVVGLVAVGFGGYNLVTTGCVLGVCRDDAQASPAVMKPVGAKGDAGSCCAEGAKASECDAACLAACEKDGKACPHMAKAGEVKPMEPAPAEAVPAAGAGG
jgi:hypothetical protein